MKKRWLFLLLIPLVFCIVIYTYMNQKPSLYVFMWSGYIKPSLIHQFEEKYHCRILSDSFDSNEAMFAKLTCGGSGYDVIFPSLYFLDLLKKKDLIDVIPKERIPNLRYVDAAFVQKIGAQETQYGVPFLVSFSGILYRSDRLSQKVTSWNVFSDPTYKGRMTLLNDIRETIGAALIVHGFNVNSTSPSELEMAKKTLFDWKKNIAKFESEQHKNGIASGEFLVSHGYASDCFQISKEHPEVHFSYPQEGSLASIDYVCLSSHAQHKELAYTFINFLLEPENAAQNMLYTGGRAPNTAAKHYLPDTLQTSHLFYPEEVPNTHIECLKPIESAQRLYSSVWDEVRNTKAYTK